MSGDSKVVVRPLEWMSEPPYSVARVPRLHLFYSTECVWDEKKFLYCELQGNCTAGTFPSREAARAAAQADFENRVLSAIELD